MNISLDKIRIDCGTQARSKIDIEVVENYAEALLEGAIFPPVTIFFDGDHYYLADGFHRYHANQKAGSPNIECTLVNGSLREAILFSLSANFDHGLHRTNADKRKAVVTMLEDFEWADWSDREIAKWCKVSPKLVATIRKEMGVENNSVKFERNGKVHTQNVESKKGGQKEDKKDDDSHVRKEADEEKEKLLAAVEMLTAENEALTDKIAVVSVSPEAAEREMAQSVIAELRSKIRLLEIDLKAVTQSRDTYQSEKAQLMKQNAKLQKQLKEYQDKK